MTVVKRTGYVAMVAAIACGISLAASNMAHADPPGFPDLSSFVTANPADYPLPLSRSTDKAVRFATPFGYTCDMGQGRFIHCYGKGLPGYLDTEAPQSKPCGQQVSTGAAPARAAYFQPDPLFCTDSAYLNYPVLPAGHKIEFRGELCAVGPDFTACRDNSEPEPRGFVLRQDGNSVLF
ncbi:hypothetical protein LK468_08845 [Mycobacteroides abscessus]|uniref:hypothetical protein n=1 Tax=Mycobacteroides TaxID=670516 RepID=UPI0009261358|nr:MULTISPECIES: hypothetical protein [Mycobacteroides]UEA49309.1 hypothetical protein LK451_03755 [Mycobacteroides abscessus subsp. abscessus]UEA54884.1 hypothetical protein LK468_08845 [Mycobacteroides abscessus]SHR17131.1 Uncharacterised protein [Mycobacteroides abscessus subsp. bolletii]SHS69562.1 Uncharacterised protein [Mycobacteroides abscessus subsp. bolletii]SHS90991.1 Uncharacterised protein [Mycobacteroides abscessus subsp. bolletii]